MTGLAKRTREDEHLRGLRKLVDTVQAIPATGRLRHLDLVPGGEEGSHGPVPSGLDLERPLPAIGLEGCDDISEAGRRYASGTAPVRVRYSDCVRRVAIPLMSWM